jgi:hypothetical protein
MLTTYERGFLAGQRRAVLLVLEGKFGPLSAVVKQRVEALSPEDLDQRVTDLFSGKSLKELRLED